MLAEHRIDIERGADVLGRIDIADLDMRTIVGGVDLLEIGGRDGEHRAARRGIARDAAAELVELAGELFLIALAEKVDLGEDPVTAGIEAQ